MTLTSSTELTAPLNDKTSALLTSTTGRWSGRKAFEILPGVFLTSMVAGTAFAIRLLPGMANFSPMILSMIIGIAVHNTVGTAARAKAGVAFSLRRLLRGAIILLGLQLTASQVIEIGGRGLGIIAAALLATFVFTVWMGKLLGVEPKLAQL